MNSLNVPFCMYIPIPLLPECFDHIVQGLSSGHYMSIFIANNLPQLLWTEDAVAMEPNRADLILSVTAGHRMRQVMYLKSHICIGKQ